MHRRQQINLYDARLQVIMPGEPDALTESTKLVAPQDYKPQSKRGKAVAKQTPRRRAHQTATHRSAMHA